MTRARAAVIGSGFGGLSTAIRLQAEGIVTVIFEARDKPGGRAYVYEDQGFIYDGGPTVITAPNIFEELFEVAGRDMRDHVEMLPVDPFYKLIWDDGDSFDYRGDSESMLALADLEAEEIVTDYSVTAIAPDAASAEKLADELLALEVVSKVQPPSEHVPADQEEKLFALEETAFFMEPVLYPEPSVEPPSDAENVESVRALVAEVDALPADVEAGARDAARALADALPEELEKLRSASARAPRSSSAG